MKKILKYLLILLAALVLLLAGAAIVAKAMFPSEKIRAMAEKELGEALRDEARIGSLSLSLTKGFEARDISIGGEKGPLKIQGIYFFYDLGELLKGRVVISRMGVDRPTFFLEKSEGRWNFQRYRDLAKAGKKPEAPATRAGGIALPALPFSINLQSFVISDLSILAKDGGCSFKWDGLDLLADLALSGQKIKLDLELRDDAKSGLQSSIEVRLNQPCGPSSESTESSPAARTAITAAPSIRLRLKGNGLEDIALAGDFRLQNLLLQSDENTYTAPAGASLDMKLDLQKGDAALNRLSLDLLEKNHIELAGAVSGLFAKPSMRVSAPEAFVDLGSLPPFLKPFLPGLSASGEIKIESLDLTAKVDERSGISGAANGKVLFDSVSLEEKDLGIALEDLSGKIGLEKADFDPVLSGGAALSVDLRLKGGRQGETVIEKASCRTESLSLALSEGRLASMAGVMAADVESLTANGAKLDDVKNRIDFHITGKDRADVEISHITEGINAKLPDGSKVFSSASMQLRVGLSGENFRNVDLRGKMDMPDLNVQSEKFTETLPLSLEPSLSLDLAEKKLSLSYLKIKLLDKTAFNITGAASSGESTDIRLDANGTLVLEEAMPIISGFMPELRANGRVDLKKTGISIKAGPEFQDFTARADGATTLKNLNVSYAGDSISGLGGDIDWKVEGITKQGTQGATGGAGARIGWDSAKAKGAEIMKAKAAFSAKTAGGGNLLVDLGLDAAEVIYAIPEKDKISVPFTVKGKGAGNIEKLNFKLESLQWSAGPALSGEASGEAKKLGKEGVRLEHRLTMDLGKLMKISGIRALSPALKGIDLSGTLSSHAAISGKLPGPDDWKKFPMSPLPLNAAMDFKIKGAGLEAKDMGISVGGVEGPVDLQYGKKGLALVSDLDFREIHHAGISPKPFSMETGVDVKLDAPERLQINKFKVAIPELGIANSLKGEAAGLSPFLKDGLEPTLANLLNSVRCSLDGGLSLQSTEPLSIAEGTRVKGRAGIEFLLSLQPKKEISLEGKVDFKDFDAEYLDMAEVRGLDGGLAFSKKLALAVSKEKSGPEGGGKTRKPAGALPRGFLPYQPKKERIAIGSVSAAGQEISQIELEPSFDGGTYSLDRFAFKALEGYAVGNLSLAKGKGSNQVRAGLEFAGIDSGKLMKEKFTKSSAVNGHLAISLPLPDSEGSRDLDIGMVDLDVNITKIGEEVLDRLLLFFDPKESNPGIVNLRSMLKLALPTKAAVKLKNGALSVSTQLKLLAMGGGLVDVNALDRVPIARLSGLEKVNEVMDGAKNFAPYLDLLFADEIRIGDGGEVWLGKIKLAPPPGP